MSRMTTWAPALALALGFGCAEGAQRPLTPGPVALAGQAAPAQGIHASQIEAILAGDRAFDLAVVRDLPPPGSPVPTLTHPPTRRASTPECGPEPPEPGLEPMNLVRWSVDVSQLGLPPGGFNVYRCCTGELDASDPGWGEPLNGQPIRPPRTPQEGAAFTPEPDEPGQQLMPDGRPIHGAFLSYAEWGVVCRILAALEDQPTTELSDAVCPPVPPPVTPTDYGDDATTDVELDPVTMFGLLAHRPEVATVMGLYFVDPEGGPGCHYKVEGDWGGGDLRARVAGPARRTALPAPTGLVATEKARGGACDRPWEPRDLHSRPEVLLKWDVSEGPLRSSAAEEPVAYNICRRGPGQPQLAQINRVPYPPGSASWVDAPVFITEYQTHLDEDGEPTARTETVLPEVFYRDDFGGLPQFDESYGYAVTAIDMFGRESKPSEVASASLANRIVPPAPVDVSAELAMVRPSTTPPAGQVRLSFAWTEAEHSRAPDTTRFGIYARVGSRDLCSGEDACQVGPQAGSAECSAPQEDWWQPIGFVDLDAWSSVEGGGEGPPAVRRYIFDHQLELQSGAPRELHFFRVVAFAGDRPGLPSGAAHVVLVDERPAQPPAKAVSWFSRKASGDQMEVRLLWRQGPDPQPPVAGYRLYQTPGLLSCGMAADCPQRCTTSGCVDMQCLSGFCCFGGEGEDMCQRVQGGEDVGPQGRQQVEGESLITDGLIPESERTARLTLVSLAEQGNLFRRGAQGQAELVAPGCQTSGAAACEAELEAALQADQLAGADAVDLGLVRLATTSVPDNANAGTSHFRVMAVSHAMVMESPEEEPSTFSPPFRVRIPDVVPPEAPALLAATLVPPPERPQTPHLDPADAFVVDPGPPPVPVVWLDQTHVGVVGASFAKTSGVDGAWDAGISSKYSFTGNGAFSVRVLETEGNRLFGLRHGAFSLDPSHIQYGVQISGSPGTLRAMESGVKVSASRPVSAGDEIRLEVALGQVRYFHEGELFHVSYSAPPADAHVFFDANFASLGGKLSDAALHQVPGGAQTPAWESATAVDVQDGGATLVANHSLFNGSATSAQRLRGDGFVAASSPAGAGVRALELGPVGEAPRYSLVVVKASLFVHERGAPAPGPCLAPGAPGADGACGAYQPGTELRIQVEGGQVRYYNAGQLLYESRLRPSGAMAAGVTLKGLGSQLDDLRLEAERCQPVIEPIAGPEPPLPAPAGSCQSWDGALALSWRLGIEPDIDGPGAGYQLYRAELGEWTTVATVVGGEASHQVPATAGACAQWRVRARSAAGEAGPVLAVASTTGEPVSLAWVLPEPYTHAQVQVRSGALAVIDSGGPMLPGDDGPRGALELQTQPGPRPTMRVCDAPPELGVDQCYALSVTDGAGNTSPVGAPLVSRLDDRVPPASPRGLGAWRTGCGWRGGAVLQWLADEPVRATVRRSTVGPEGPWVTLAHRAAATPIGALEDPLEGHQRLAGSPAVHRFEVPDASSARTTWFEVELTDTAGHTSAVALVRLDPEDS